MFFDTADDTPETFSNRAGDAVFKSTPTVFTQSSTTPESASFKRLGGISCWYCPTPIAFGSILTSSASGSCKRRAMETALRRVTSKSGNSWAASLLAE